MSGDFTGERLQADDPLFQVDLARHRAAYRIALDVAREQAARSRVLDLGSGSGYGTAALASAGLRVAGLDRVAPAAESRGPGRFVRGDVTRAPFAAGTFPLVVSFQVIEHLEDPTPYLSEMARLVAPGGAVLVTTPNRLRSEGVNPYHVHEYVADELEALLRGHFERVEMRGVGTSDRVRPILDARSRRIRRIMRLDPLRLRERLPQPLVLWLFARLAVLVRRVGGDSARLPDVDWRDYPVGPADDDSLDLLAICRRGAPA
jgi:SAM-dependent methyltransferase